MQIITFWVNIDCDVSDKMVVVVVVVVGLSAPTREGVTGGCRRLDIEQLRHSYPSPSIIRMIQLRRCEHRLRQDSWE
jgi:hypothetical protein